MTSAYTWTELRARLADFGGSLVVILFAYLETDTRMSSLVAGGLPLLALAWGFSKANGDLSRYSQSAPI